MSRFFERLRAYGGLRVCVLSRCFFHVAVCSERMSFCATSRDRCVLLPASFSLCCALIPRYYEGLPMPRRHPPLTDPPWCEDAYGSAFCCVVSPFFFASLFISTFSRQFARRSVVPFFQADGRCCSFRLFPRLDLYALDSPLPSFFRLRRWQLVVVQSRSFHGS